MKQKWGVEPNSVDEFWIWKLKEKGAKRKKKWTKKVKGKAWKAWFIWNRNYELFSVFTCFNSTNPYFKLKLYKVLKTTTIED